MSRVPLLAISSVAGSILLNRYAPAYNLSDSLVIRTIVLFWAQVLILSTWSMLLYPHCFSPIRRLPQPVGANWLMGHFGKIRKETTGEPQREWMETVPNDGLIYYRFAFNSERVLLTSPTALAEVLVHKNYEFIKPQQIRHGLGRVLGIGLILAEGEEHRHQRKALMPAFSFRHIKDLYPVFWKKSQEAAESMATALEQSCKGLEKSSAIDIANWASRATLDIIGVAGMGEDFNALQNPESELNVTYRKIFSPNKVARLLQLLGVLVPLSVVRRIPVKRNFEVADAATTIKRVAYDLIQEKRQKMEKGEQRTDVDILSVAIESGGFTDEELVNQVMTFLAAGHETVAAAMIWAVYLLCKYPHVQKRLREEIHANIPSLHTTITSTDIDRLQYLNAVCNEATRIYPPVPMTLRIAAKNTTILGHFIPKGTTVIISPWAINTNRQLWGNDADEFDPDRWMGPGRANSGGADSNYSFLTFLHGPRSCIGQGFAKAEFACLLAAWVGKFEMELTDPNWKLEVQGGITARPKGNLPIKLTPLTSW
ncbi:uncharacterized protein K452DRAFT_323042 [Aplosporella prunicola CBS 121167]|uniref:Cytochrome P450 monooxygenase n=1 Tax=Aplosporella prunicola CBS 121167 TaxID=1176127 RepID=A0A6A6AU32_9PEZI|nr:uncharacterized protein K452DRAFT_323042 [Aplosporella prunicola CBS 121167]KAF2135459.1 hypothetical protein K452DRAFT_323042 [Aplosporella prunicola CBS 121167]